MKATISMDEVGRLVLPKGIREAIGIVGRMAVNVEVVDNAALITVPAPARGVTARKRGRLVYAGPLPQNWDSGEAVTAMRQRRIHR
jgi:bifunctional DNA-binding transcriptional regulator/antitoxin component of YhaV-PrlF toxin-antitoxin module